jgi:hypothetical protein
MPTLQYSYIGRASLHSASLFCLRCRLQLTKSENRAEAAASQTGSKPIRTVPGGALMDEELEAAISALRRRLLEGTLPTRDAIDIGYGSGLTVEQVVRIMLNDFDDLRDPSVALASDEERWDQFDHMRMLLTDFRRLRARLAGGGALDPDSIPGSVSTPLV